MPSGLLSLASLPLPHRRVSPTGVTGLARSRRLARGHRPAPRDPRILVKSAANDPRPVQILRLAGREPLQNLRPATRGPVRPGPRPWPAQGPTPGHHWANPTRHRFLPPQRTHCQKLNIIDSGSSISSSQYLAGHRSTAGRAWRPGPRLPVQRLQRVQPNQVLTRKRLGQHGLLCAPCRAPRRAVSQCNWAARRPAPAHRVSCARAASHSR